jgi:hypothetical protein
MLIFMFLSSFLHNFACYIGETTFFATKVLLFSHIRKRGIFFFNKKSNFASFSSPISLCFPFVCHLSPSESHRNLIGTSSEDERMIKQLSPSKKSRPCFVIAYRLANITSLYTLLKNHNYSCIYPRKVVPLQS